MSLNEELAQLGEIQQAISSEGATPIYKYNKYRSFWLICQTHFNETMRHSKKRHINMRGKRDENKNERQLPLIIA